MSGGRRVKDDEVIPTRLCELFHLAENDEIVNARSRGADNFDDTRRRKSARKRTESLIEEVVLEC
jgi:hypothetical protein